MKYYTKEWYELMQNLHYVSGMTVVPDKKYTDAEIQAFYDADLTEEIEHDRWLYDTPPVFFDFLHLTNKSLVVSLFSGEVLCLQRKKSPSKM